MSKKKSSLAGLQALFARVCGLDVHKKLVVACVRILDSKDGTVQSTLRKCGTMTADLLELRQRLAEQKVTMWRWSRRGCTGSRCSTCSKDIFSVGGQRRAHQEGAWAKDRHEGRGVDSASRCSAGC